MASGLSLSSTSRCCRTVGVAGTILPELLIDRLEMKDPGLRLRASARPEAAVLGSAPRRSGYGPVCGGNCAARPHDQFRRALEDVERHGVILHRSGPIPIRLERLHPGALEITP